MTTGCETVLVARSMSEDGEWERGYNAALSDLVRPLESQVASLRRDLRDAQILFAAAVLSNGGTLRISGGDLLSAAPMLERWNDPSSNSLVFRVAE